MCLPLLAAHLACTDLYALGRSDRHLHPSDGADLQTVAQQLRRHATCAGMQRVRKEPMACTHIHRRGTEGHFVSVLPLARVSGNGAVCAVTGALWARMWPL